MTQNNRNHHFAKNKLIQYMDVKYMSECVDMERRHLKLKIFEYRQANKQQPTNVISLYQTSFKKITKRDIKQAFLRYARTTQLYHATRLAYLKQLSKM
jgi:hypothetical protein